jgi:hypothetical protein
VPRCSFLGSGDDLELAFDPLQEGLAILVALLIGPDCLDLVLGETLDLLLYLPDAQPVVADYGDIIGVLAGFLSLMQEQMGM